MISVQVMIWRQAKTAGSAPFGSSAPAVEGWRAVATLRGHAGDVIDLAWSPADVYLATCSVDNLLMVWDAARWGQPVATLKGHTGESGGWRVDRSTRNRFNELNCCVDKRSVIAGLLVYLRRDFNCKLTSRWTCPGKDKPHMLKPK